MKDQFSYIFGKLFDISCHSPEDENVKPIFNADMIVLHEPSALVKMQNYIHCECPVLLMRRTITWEALDKLKKLPNESRACIVNVTDYMAHETMTNIYQLGIKNIELIPWAPDCHRDFPDVDVVLTHRMYDFLPSTDKSIVILGSRVITADVIMDILSYFDASNKLIDEVMSRYMTLVPKFQKGVHSLHENNQFLTAQWEMLFDKIRQSVAIITTDNELLSENTHFKQLFASSWQRVNTIAELATMHHSLNIILENDEVHEEVIDIEGRQYLINVNYLDTGNKSLGRIIILDPYYQLLEQQQIAHKKIVGSGHIAKYSFDDIIGHDPSMLRVKELGRKFAMSTHPILIYGESGTGKELLSSAIHRASPRHKAPFIAVNCAGIPDALLESEFFGYDEASFTGAKKGGKVGLFEKADSGTLFLDEISELPYPLQAKLLRAIQEQEIRRVGSTQTISINVRIIAASNKSLEDLIAKGLFRKDLYYRINVFSLSLPPLRERHKDIQILANNFLAKSGKSASSEFYSFIGNYEWPGNIRELINIIHYMTTIATGELNLSHLPDYIKAKNMTLDKNNNNDQEALKLLLLKAINECKNRGQSTGRRNLSRFLSDHYYKVTEATTRKLLIELEAKGLININIGRVGSVLTNKGKMLLESLNA